MRTHHTAARTLVTVVILFCAVPRPTVSAAPAASSAETGLTILSPAGGEILRVNDSITFQWDLDASSIISDALVIEISPNNGLTYLHLGWSINRTSPEFAARRIGWRIPDSLYHKGMEVWFPLQSDSCVLFMHGYSDYSIFGYSQPFSIAAKVNAHESTVPQRASSPRVKIATLTVEGVAERGEARGFTSIDPVVFLTNGRIIRSPERVGGPGVTIRAAAGLSPGD